MLTRETEIPAEETADESTSFPWKAVLLTLAAVWFLGVGGSVAAESFTAVATLAVAPLIAYLMLFHPGDEPLSDRIIFKKRKN